jgi:PAS domain S-box-containing protein
MLRGINQPGGVFNVGILPSSLALVSAIVAILSYFLASERNQTPTALGAYIISLASVVVLITQTGEASSPFLALWMIASIFSGVFGMVLLGTLTGGIVAIFAVLAVTNNLDTTTVFSLLLAGLLPLLMSFVLWHGKSSTEKTKERAYYDLANELNQVANKSEVVINAISDGVIAIGNTGQIELINPAAERLVGWVHQDAMNLDYKSVMQLLSKDGHELDKSTDPVFDVLTTNQPKRRDDLQLQTSSGKKVVIEMVVSPIGRLGSGAIIVFRDITKEQAEERAQAEFISTASHEMRTPVASIEGYLGLTLNPATATIDAKAHDYITKAHEAAEHLGRLFQDLLDVTKADDGRLQNNPKVIDIVSFTSDIIEGLKPKADEKQLRLFFKAAKEQQGSSRNLEPLFYVDLDADHLREVLSNLIENAIKYTPKGEVVIDIEGDDEHIVVSIQDSGIGIPTEDIPHLFQKFYRVDNSDTREIGGTGLGLYLCRRLVETMSGRIWVESEYKKGSTFSVELPRVSNQEAQRLIEAASTNAIKPSVATNTLKEDKPDTNDKEVDPSALTNAEKQRALATPIIMSRSKLTAAPSAPIVAARTTATPPIAPGEQASDPFATPTPEVAAAPPEPLRAQNPMVLPVTMQDMKTTVQKAPAPVQTPPPPTPAPAPKPAPPPISAPPAPKPAPIPTPAPAPAPVQTPVPKPVTAPVAAPSVAPPAPQPAVVPGVKKT